MNTPSTSTHRSLIKTSLWSAILLLIAMHAVSVRADSTDGSTPLALQPGAPAGSYALSDLDNINPYNGSLNFRLPLMKIGGRGTAGYTMMLPFEQKWRISALPIYQFVYADGGNGPLPEPNVTYHYFRTANWWTGIKPGYGPGVLQGRVAQFDAQVCPDSTMTAVMTLTRLTFSAPDGTEFELRDKQTGGEPAGVALCAQAGFNRGKVFVTADGSAATFISTQDIVDYIVVPNGGNDLFYPTGDLLLRDGTHYRIDNGTVTWLRDRNGNKMTFDYDTSKRVTKIKDSLNREVNVSYSTPSVAYDEITFKGFGGAQRTMRVNYALLGDPGSLRSGSIQTYSQLFPIAGSSQPGNYNPTIVRSVTLPNNQEYQFQYNSYGELGRVVLPTGGALEYDHASGTAGDPNGVVGGFEEYALNIYRRVVSRRVYANGSTLESKMTFSSTESVPCSGCVVVDQFGSDGTTRISQKRLYYEGTPINSFFLAPTDYSPWKDGREYQSESLATDASTILQRVVHTWEQPTVGSSWPLSQSETNAAAKTNNPQITQTVTTLEPAQANKVSKQTFAYDKYTNQTDVYEYNFGTGTAGSLVRRRHTDYLTASYDTLNPNSTNPDLNQTSHIRSLPTQVSVFDAANNERARSTIEYDNHVPEGSNCSNSFHCALQARSDISGLDSLPFTKRGNATAVTRYLLSNNQVTGSITSYSQYDVAGNVVRVIDPRSTLSNIIATTIDYDDRFGSPDNEARSNSAPAQLNTLKSYAFPTKVINALGHTAYAQFDYYLGKPVNGEDPNGVVAAGYFNDSLDRPRQIRRAIGTSVENQTTFDYDDVARTITTSSDKDAVGDNLLVGKVLYDQMGRAIEARQYEGGTNYIVTKTEYDALSRPFKTSNPFRPWQSETAVWTTQIFDALGRVKTVTTPDNAVLNTDYAGNKVTVTDQTGKKRSSVTDALGRLIEVYEDPNGVNYQTSYLFDVLDNLNTVTQASQTRSFTYDSLSRLRTAFNPESGTISYQYDDNSNLVVKTDARGVSSHFEYDALNRATRRWYNGSNSVSSTTHNSPVLPSGVGATNEVKFYYDSQALPAGAPSYTRGASVGRLVAQTYGSGSNGDYLAFDVLGRPTLKYQQTGTINYQVSAGYNLSGAATSLTYPSGHTTTNAYDQAGRLSTFSGNLGDGTTRNYASGVLYSPIGGLVKEQFGTNTPLYNKLFYNSRGQLAEIRVSTSYTGPTDTTWNRGAIINHYSDQCWGMCGGSNSTSPMTDNNGNLKKQEVYIPNDDQVSSYTMRWQQYDYDSLNRLNWAREILNTTEQWKQQFNYDRWGNRTIDKNVSYGTGINEKEFTVNATNNRLGVPATETGLMSYDAAGNLINDTYTGAGNRTYDAENKITSAWGGNNQAQLYSYDASGQRIRRTVDGVETWQVYGLGGELLAEYSANGAVGSPQKEYGYRNGQLLITATAGTIHSLNLNGTNAYVQVPYSSSLNITGAITVEAWIKVNAIGAYQDIISRESYAQSGTGGGYELSVTNTGKVRLDLYQSPTSYTPVIGNTTITTNAWHHVAGVFDGSQMRVYLDGVLDGTLSTTNAPASGTSSLKIGRSSSGAYFNGLIDDARVSNAAMYTSNFTPQTNPTPSGSTKGLWKFNGLSTADSSSNGNNGSLQGGASFSGDVPTGGTSYYSGSFNGTTAYVQVPDNTSLNITGAITVEAWIKVNAIGAYQDIVSRESYSQAGTGGGYELSVTNTGKVRLDLYQTPTTYTPVIGSTTITTNAWHHVAGVFDGSQMRIYLNGVLDGTLSTTNAPASGTSSLKLGRSSYGSFFNGLIDEARVSNTAVYTGNFTPQTHSSSTSSTKGLWKFDGQSTADSSSNGNNGTLQGGATYSDDVPGGGGGGGTSSGSGPQVQWLVADHLGTPRMIIDQTGSLANVKRHDYLPFGEELFTPTGGRLAAQGYGCPPGQPGCTGDQVRQQFTLQERDIEIGLDYFGARYYSSTQGRFTSADPLHASATISDPQSFNRYSYVRNMPLTSIDPNGMDDCQMGKTCSFTTMDWATSGNHPEEGEIQESVTLIIPPAAPIVTSSIDPSAVSLNFKDLTQPVLMDQTATPGPGDPATAGGGGISWGVTASGTLAGGIGLAGAGSTGGGLWGYFYDGETGVASTGGGLGGGAQAYILAGDRAATPRAIVSAVEINDDESASVLGASAGGGVGLFFTNAKRPEELRGPFQTRQLNTPWFGLQFDQSGNTKVFSFTLGPSLGASYWSGKTATVTTPALPRPF